MGKLACEVDQWNRRPPSWGRGISLSLDLTQLTRVHRANLIRQGYRLMYVDVKTTQNSTGGTGTHSAGELTKTEVSGKKDS